MAAYRLPYLLAGGSLVFKQDSQYYEHFYHHLQPWVHYVPLERDVSDVVERLEWALENDDQVTYISVYHLHTTLYTVCILFSIPLCRPRRWLTMPFSL